MSMIIRIGTPRERARMSAVGIRASLMNQTPTSIPTVSLSINVVSGTRQFLVRGVAQTLLSTDLRSRRRQQ